MFETQIRYEKNERMLKSSIEEHHASIHNEDTKQSDPSMKRAGAPPNRLPSLKKQEPNQPTCLGRLEAHPLPVSRGSGRMALKNQATGRRNWR